jgi:hypothetical protein
MSSFIFVFQNRSFLYKSPCLTFLVPYAGVVYTSLHKRGSLGCTVQYTMYIQCNLHVFSKHSSKTNDPLLSRLDKDTVSSIRIDDNFVSMSRINPVFCNYVLLIFELTLVTPMKKT